MKQLSLTLVLTTAFLTGCSSGFDSDFKQIISETKADIKTTGACIRAYSNFRLEDLGRREEEIEKKKVSYMSNSSRNAYIDYLGIQKSSECNDSILEAINQKQKNRKEIVEAIKRDPNYTKWWNEVKSDNNLPHELSITNQELSHNLFLISGAKVRGTKAMLDQYK
jgi:hypothetical protein